MSRIIVIDGNVLDEIFRGNSAAADALVAAVRRGDRVYISTQAYNEVVVNNLPRHATANRMILERYNITLPPATTLTARGAVYGDNQTRTGTILSEPDSLVAAEARALRAEVWSFDRAYRTNAAVTSRLGVRVAPECGLSFAARQIKPGDADYRVGFRLLGLPPTDIRFNGQVVPRSGPPGSPPGAPGTPPASPPPPQGSAGGGSSARSTPGQGGTVARVGVADNSLPQVGGPSPRGVAIGNGITLAFQGANFVLNEINDRIQQERIQQALRQEEGALGRQRLENSSLGVLIIFYFRQVEPPSESIIRPGPVFTHLEVATGRSLDEARVNHSRTPAIRQGAGPRENMFTRDQWIQPLIPDSVGALRPPFPSAAVGTFASPKLQDVNWGGVTGFDDEGETTFDIANGTRPEFVLLVPPRVIRWLNGQTRMTTDIPLVTRWTADGTPITVVDLDPWVPGNASAAMAFPADNYTDGIFGQAPATFDNLGQLRGYLNVRKMRWIRPENIRFLRSLSQAT